MLRWKWFCIFGICFTVVGIVFIVVGSVVGKTKGQYTHDTVDLLALFWSLLIIGLLLVLFGIGLLIAARLNDSRVVVEDPNSRQSSVDNTADAVGINITQSFRAIRSPDHIVVNRQISTTSGLSSLSPRSPNGFDFKSQPFHIHFNSLMDMPPSPPPYELHSSPTEEMPNFIVR